MRDWTYAQQITQPLLSQTKAWPKWSQLVSNLITAMLLKTLRFNHNISHQLAPTCKILSVRKGRVVADDSFSRIIIAPRHCGDSQGEAYKCRPWRPSNSISIKRWAIRRHGHSLYSVAWRESPASSVLQKMAIIPSIERTTLRIY